jgi:MFS family permease
VRWEDSVILIHLVATLLMTGLIWFVQIVHYPLLANVGVDGFVKYEQLHKRKTTWAVAPLMCAEALTAFALLFISDLLEHRGLLITGIVLLGIIWLSTALLQVPCHQQLSRGHDDYIVRRLVRTNWIRTTTWTLRALIAVSIV